MQFDQQEVLAVACALYRINGEVVRANDHKDPTSKEQIVDHFVNNKPVEVTDVDREYADLCLKHLQHRVLMNQLTDRHSNDFMNSITEMTFKTSISNRQLGIAVWIPKVVAGMQAEDQQKIDLAHMAAISRYQGKKGEKLEVNFHPIRIKWVHEISCFRHFGHDGNGNLIGFLNKKELSGKIKGKVKSQEVSKYHNGGRVTYLNYVKGAE
jgi:hypothetical protein